MNRYYIIFDTTKDYGNIYHAQYLQTRTNTDLIGFVIGFAQRNKTSIEDIRLMEFNTKKEYEASYKNWLDKVAEIERQKKQGGIAQWKWNWQ